jgi:hypothetical protein
LWPIEQIPALVLGDLDPEFIKSLSTRLYWEYDLLYDSLSEHLGVPGTVLNEEFCSRRSNCATKALVSACRTHGVPYDFRRLPCNGQNKIMVKVGRLVLIQEPMATRSDHPRLADYKRELSESYGILRQPEFDLGDLPGRILDLSGCILGVVLHGAAGPWFTREHKALGGLILGIPDTAYEHWVHRFDLLQIARFGREEPIEEPQPAGEPSQEDRVNVTPKNRNAAKRTDR